MSDAAIIQHVDLDLDAEERPESEAIRPFAVNLGGRRIVMQDPSDLDWQDLLDIQQPHDFLRHAVSPEDRKHILSLRIPGWKFGKLMEAYMEHYKLEDKVAQARRQGRLG